MQRKLVRDAGRIDLRSVLDSLPGGLGWHWYVQPEQELVLTLERLMQCEGVEPTLTAFASAVRSCAERYLASDEPDAVVSSEELCAALKLGETECQKIGRLLPIGGGYWRTASGPGPDGTWNLTLSDDIHWYRDVVTIEDFFAAKEELQSLRQRASAVPSLAPAATEKDGEMKDVRSVFVAYGRDETARRALFELLRAAGLRPLEWEQAVRLSGKGSPYVGDVVEMALNLAQAVVVLLTGDDMAFLRKELLEPGEREEEPRPQPRPNVILEAGMALARNPDRTLIVQLGELRGMSDLLGRHVVRLDNTPQRRKALLQRLETAGCAVDLSGDDWITAGQFTAQP